jgi:hypothetical protein
MKEEINKDMETLKNKKSQITQYPKEISQLKGL